MMIFRQEDWWYSSVTPKCLRKNYRTARGTMEYVIAKWTKKDSTAVSTSKTITTRKNQHNLYLDHTQKHSVFNHSFYLHQTTFNQTNQPQLSHFSINHKLPNTRRFQIPKSTF